MTSQKGAVKSGFNLYNTLDRDRCPYAYHSA